MSESLLKAAGVTGPARDTAAERRRSVRTDVISTGLTPVDIEPGATGGLMLNLSATGMALQCVTHQQVGTRKKLRWQFSPDAPWIEVDGEIVWCDDFNVSGVRFVAISAQAAACIQGWRQNTTRGAYSGVSDTSCLRFTGVVDSWRLNRPQFQTLVEETQKVSGADGAAIVIASELVCHTAKGTPPEMGATLLALADSRLSAECLRNGVAVYCSDTDSDPRMNAEVCRHMGLRSAILVPVKSPGNEAGVLACAYSKPHSFGDDEIRELCRLAETVVQMLYSRDTDAEGETSKTVSVAQSIECSGGTCGLSSPLLADTVEEHAFSLTVSSGSRSSVRVLLIVLLLMLFFALGIGGYLWHIGRLPKLSTSVQLH